MVASTFRVPLGRAGIEPALALSMLLSTGCGPSPRGCALHVMRVADLEKLGLLARRRDTVDERQVRVKLTGEGRALRCKARELPECIAEAIGLSESRLAKLVADIVGMRDRLATAAD